MYEEEIHFGKLFLKQFERVFEHLTLVTLTFDTETPKSIGFICYPGWMCGLSLKKVCQGVLELLIGHKKVKDNGTYRQTGSPTGRPTCAKQYALSSSKGGIHVINIMTSFWYTQFKALFISNVMIITLLSY